MTKKINYLALLIVLIVFYGSFVFLSSRNTKQGEYPIITIENSNREISVKDDENILLQGVKATDKEDGDLTDQIFIEDISSFNEKKERTITYAVFDSDDHLVRKTALISYFDYEEPTIQIIKPFVYYNYVNNDEFISYLKATSCIDGDISSLLTLDKVNYDENNNRILTFSIIDSCGTKTSLEVKSYELMTSPNIEITLKSYMKIVKKGTSIETISPRSNIKNIELMGIKNNALKEKVEITNNYDATKEGTYEFIYRIASTNGDYGLTKMIVVVE